MFKKVLKEQYHEKKGSYKTNEGKDCIIFLPSPQSVYCFHMLLLAIRRIYICVFSRLVLLENYYWMITRISDLIQ